MSVVNTEITQAIIENTEITVDTKRKKKNFTSYVCNEPVFCWPTIEAHRNTKQICRPLINASFGTF